MKSFATIAALIAVLLLIAGLIVPLWTKTAAISLDPFAFKMIVLMVIGCFVVGGGLMFLVFYSARKGYDDRVHHGGGQGPDREL